MWGKEDESWIEAGLSFLSKVLLTWSEEGSEEGIGEYFLIVGQVFEQEGTWWDLLLGRSEMWDAVVEDKAKAIEDDATVEC